MLELPVHDHPETLEFDARTAPADSSPRAGTVCVVGLGYVGLPVAVAFGKARPTVGYDLASAKVRTLCQHFDPTGEVPPEELRQATQLACTDDPRA